MGEFREIQQIYVEHTKDAIESLGEPCSQASSYTSTHGALEDGVYTAKFDTDSSMFHVNEADDGRGTLTVKDGKMTFHVSLAV